MVHKRILKTLVEAPTKSQLEIIRKEINEDNEDKLKHNEELLFSWLECQPNFPKNYEKNIARNFLRNSKHAIERARTKLEHNLIARHLYPEYFSHRSPRSIDMVKAIDTTNVVPLPKLSKHGYRIWIFKYENLDPSNFDVDQAIKLYFMLYDMLLMDPYPIGGDVLVFDEEGITANHIVKFLSSILRKLVVILREAYAIRMKQIHIVNGSPLMDKLFTFVKPLLHPKVRNNFVIHNNIQSLTNYFGEDILPSNYGGKCKSLRELMSDWQEILNENEDWFLEQEKVKITEGVPKKTENLLYFKDELGVDGSFRKLEID